ncbi:MAG: hypothetical protein Q9160_003663 [Pyrenula sp. 1 TL-2023]
MSSEEDQLDSPLADDQVPATNGAEEQDDLFGSEDEKANKEDTQRKLDDSELDSGDDEDRRDRAPTPEDDEIDYGLEPRKEVVSSIDLARIKDPETNDGELYMLSMPEFLGIEQENFDPATYVPPTQNHGGREGKFSSFDVASTSLFWRHDPKDPRKLQSNSRIIRWSDGSLTLQNASSPKDQYRFDAKALRQTPANPRRPLPASTHPKPNTAYDPSRDTHFYLGAPHETSGLFRVIAPFSAGLRLLPTGDESDSAIKALQAGLEAANATEDPVSSVRILREDPEEARRQAEQFEKDRVKAIRRREAAEAKDTERKSRVLARRGMRPGGAGLTVGGLEDDEEGFMTTRPKKKPKKRANRRGEILTDSEEDGGYGLKGRSREDNYDMEDDFMAGSDEEIETYEDDERDAEGEEEDPDVDDLEIEGRETVVQEKTRGGLREESPKRRYDEVEQVPAGSPPHARKKRNIISDDEDE